MADTTTIDGGARLREVDRAERKASLRVAINLLTEDPAKPSGADLCWARVIPEMAKCLEDDEQLHLLVSPKSKPNYQGYGPNVRYITFPWSNERRSLRTLSEHVYSPARLPLNKIDVFATLMAPLVNPSWSVVIHMRTMHAYSAPGSVKNPCARVPPHELPALSPGGGGHRRKLGEPALGGTAIPRCRPGQVQVDLRSCRPRPLQTRERGRGPLSHCPLRSEQTFRFVRVLFVAVQEL